MTAVECLWRHPLSNLTLLRNEIHIWRANLNLPESQFEKLAPILSVDEQRRAKQFYFAQHRKHFVAGRGFLRLLLGRYLNQPPSQLQFSYGPNGKPVLASSRIGGTLSFNVSHSNGLALFAFTRDRSIGIDLEYLRPIDAEQVAKRFFSLREYAALSSLTPEQKQEAFFNSWTRKEAYLKATGIGITRLKQVEVSLTPGEPAVLLSIAGDDQAASRWSLYQLNPAPGYVATTAVEGHGWQLTDWKIFPKSDLDV